MNDYNFFLKKPTLFFLLNDDVKNLSKKKNEFKMDALHFKT